MSWPLDTTPMLDVIQIDIYISTEMYCNHIITRVLTEMLIFPSFNSTWQLAIYIIAQLEVLRRQTVQTSHVI